MTKKRARVGFILLGIFTIIGIVLSFCSFNIPFTTYRYNGFANSISLGLDLSGGVSAVYEANLSEDSGTTDLNNAVESTVGRLENILFENGYTEAQVTRQGDSKICVEVPNLSDTGELFDLIGQPASLYITSEQDFDLETTTKDYVSGQDITDVYVSYNEQDKKYGVVLNFNDKGSDLFSSITGEVSSDSGSKELYVFIGENEPLVLTCEEQRTQGSTFISGGSLEDYESAKEYALMIQSGTFSANLSLLESSIISATLGKDALFYGLIAGIVALVIIMIIMAVRYRLFGLMANFSLLIYLVLMLFFLQAIPFVQLTLPGIAGIILSLGMAVDGNIIIFERIREEYATGKKTNLAIKGGFKKAFWPIFDSNITTIITSVILLILGTSSIKGFSITLLLGIVLSMFSTLVVTRVLCKWLLPFVASKPKLVSLKRGKNFKKDKIVIEESTTPEQEVVVEVTEWKRNLKNQNFQSTLWLKNQTLIIVKILNGSLFHR